jgi:hypothetical protein
METNTIENIDIKSLSQLATNVNNFSDEELRLLFCVLVSIKNPLAIATILTERIIKYIRTGQD